MLGVFAIMMLLGGVFFTVVAVVAWREGKRVAATALAVIAGVDLAVAVQFLIQFVRK